MQFFIKLSILLGVVLFNNFNTNVLYFPNKLQILNPKFAGCKAVNNLSADLTVKKKSEELSHESPNDTLKGDNNLFVEKYVDQNQEDLVENEYKTDDSLDFNTDVDLDDNRSYYDSLCFSDVPQVGEPLQLVYPNKDHTELVLDYEVLKVLERIPKPVYPVALIGSVNSGKSFLLNLLNDNYFCNVYNTSDTDSDSFDSTDGSRDRRYARNTRNSRNSRSSRNNRNSRNNRSKTRKYSHDAVNRRFEVTGAQHVEPKGFRVSSSPEPETYGIWVYSEPLKLSRFKLQRLMKENADKVNLNFYSLKNVSPSNDSNSLSKLSRMSTDYELNQVVKNDNLDDVVNVVFLDVEGFNSHKNVFKYDEALFSVVSSICSEVVYLSNKTLNTSDLQLIEELIKSSLLSKISNLYTAYSDMGETRDEREEIFQYFLKMFENKNLTFLVNEFNFSSDKGFENLVNLLKAPKRDLSLHEVYMYHNKQKTASKSSEEHQDLVKKLKSTGDQRSFDKLKEGDELYENRDYTTSDGFNENQNRENRYYRVREDEEESESKNKNESQNQYQNKYQYEKENESQNQYQNKYQYENKDVVTQNVNDKYVCTNRTMQMEDVMFNSFGYIFHMLFNSVNMAVLPSTSLNPFMNDSYFGFGDGRHDYEYKDRLSVEEEYVDKLSNFKFGLFARSTQNPLVKYCVIDGVNSNCHMTGRDLAEMVRLTVNTLSLNKFYKLVTNLGPVEGTTHLDYKDAFDEYFRVFRSTRLLMIKNDLYETYKTILKKFVDGDLVKGRNLDLSSSKSSDQSSNTSNSSNTNQYDQYDQSSQSYQYDSGVNQQFESDVLSENSSLDQYTQAGLLMSDRIPSISMLRDYGYKLKEQLLNVMVKNFENEAFTEDFNNIKKDLVQGLDRVFYLAEAELSTKIRNYCMGVGENLLKDYNKKTSRMTLPVLPSRLKFLHNLPEQFGNRFKSLVDYGFFESEEDREENLGLDADPDSSDGYARNTNYNKLSEVPADLLSQDVNCVAVYEEYLAKLQENTSGVFKKNRELIDAHFHSVFNRAMNHYRTRFVDNTNYYEIPLQEALEKSQVYLKEAENVLVTHLGEFHAIETMATSYKSHLSNELEAEQEKFKKNYAKNCSNILESITSHYVDRYHELLGSYASMPANPEMLHKYYEYMSLLSQTEVLRVICAEPVYLVEANNKLSSKLKKKYSESLVNNAKAVGKGLSSEFEKMDKYLLEQVPTCRFYNYFRHNAKRYAKYKITKQLIFSQLNLETSTTDPADVFRLEEVLYNPENADPVKNTKNTLSTSKRPVNRYHVDLKDMKNRFINLNTDKLHKKFVDLVVDYYVKNHVSKFKKMFVNKYYRTTVLICSVTLLGFSGLSMCLAQNWFIKLAFSLLGFVSYGFLVGLDKFRSNSTAVLSLFERVLAKGVSEVWHLIGLGFEKLWDLVIRLITMAFMEAGHMQTFKFGIMTAIAIYMCVKLLIRRLRSKKEPKKEGGSRKWW